MMNQHIYHEERRALLEEKRMGLTGPAHEQALRIVDDLIHAMHDALIHGDAEKAFSQGVAAKSFRLPVINLDYWRARTFISMGRLLEAEQSFKEELRNFPNNTQARHLLEELRQDRTTAAAPYDGSECAGLLALVREHSMLGEARLQSLYALARSVCERDIPGNFIECGVAGGGSSALLAMVIARHSKRPRRLYSLDTFEGMPDSSEADLHQGTQAEATGWGAGTCAAPESAVRLLLENFEVSGIVETVKGLFQQTLPVIRQGLAPVAFLHLDGDWYDSTMTVLQNLHGLYSPGAMIQIDDYGYWDGCRQAVHEFERLHSVRFNLRTIDGTGVWCEAPE